MSSTPFAGSPDEGIDLAEYNGGALVGTTVSFLVITYISVFLRCYVRTFLTNGFQVDDWLMLVAQAIFTLSCAFVLRGVYEGLGHHNAALADGPRINSLMLQALATATYIVDMMFIKLSIATFLLRLAVEPVYRWILYVSMAVVGIWSVVVFVWDIFQCSPVQAQWDYTIVGARCVTADQIVSAAYSISVMTIVTDWLYALMPIPMVWKVKMTPQQKGTVVIILGLGIFASVATLIRLKFLSDLTQTEDILFIGTEPMVWTLVEPGVAIVASSLATIRPLLRAMRLRGFGSSGGGEDNMSRSYRRRYGQHRYPIGGGGGGGGGASGGMGIGASSSSAVDNGRSRDDGGGAHNLSPTQLLASQRSAGGRRHHGRHHLDDDDDLDFEPEELTLVDLEEGGGLRAGFHAGVGGASGAGTSSNTSTVNRNSAPFAASPTDESGGGGLVLAVTADVATSAPHGRKTSPIERVRVVFGGKTQKEQQRQGDQPPRPAVGRGDSGGDGGGVGAAASPNEKELPAVPVPPWEDDRGHRKQQQHTGGGGRAADAGASIPAGPAARHIASCYSGSADSLPPPQGLAPPPPPHRGASSTSSPTQIRRPGRQQQEEQQQRRGVVDSEDDAATSRNTSASEAYVVGGAQERGGVVGLIPRFY